MPSRWIQGALAKHRRGALHRDLGIAPGERIPLDVLHEAADHPERFARSLRHAAQIRRRAQLALTLRGFARKRERDRTMELCKGSGKVVRGKVDTLRRPIVALCRQCGHEVEVYNSIGGRSLANWRKHRHTTDGYVVRQVRHGGLVDAYYYDPITHEASHASRTKSRRR